MVSSLLIVTLLLGAPDGDSDEHSATTIPSKIKLPPGAEKRPEAQQALKMMEDMRGMEKPKTCADQCKMMNVLAKQSCAMGEGGKKMPDASRKSCEDQFKSMADTCVQSCKEKGSVDGEYMKKHLKMPKGVNADSPDRPEQGPPGGHGGE